MKKLFLFIIALTLSAGLWAQDNLTETQSLPEKQAKAIADIADAIESITDETILAIADQAKTDINAATTKEDVETIKTFALTKINALVLIHTARQGIQNEILNNWIDGAINDIKNGGPDATPGIGEIKEEILNVISFFKEGKAEAKEELLGNMAEPCTGCTAVEVTDGITTVTLYKPTKVSYIKK